MLNNYIEHIEAVCQTTNIIGTIVLWLAEKGFYGDFYIQIVHQT